MGKTATQQNDDDRCIIVERDNENVEDMDNISLDESRSDGPPRVQLDPAYYRTVDALDTRFPEGPPSLVDCRHFTVEGDVTFGEGVRVVGDARVSAQEGQSGVVPAHTVIENSTYVT